MFAIERIASALKPRVTILALGTDTKQCLCWSYQGFLFSLRPRRDCLSIDDFYQNALVFLCKIKKVCPKYLVFDPHPLFAGRAAARAAQIKFWPQARLYPVYHHVAHVANFGIEAAAHRKFIGVAFDGTGYGQDGMIWGGEFFYYDKQRFGRMGHLEYQPMPGAEAAIWQPWRMALGILYHYFGRKVFSRKLKFFSGISRLQLTLTAQMIDKNFNSPQTSSAGRLFDAVAALLRIKTVVKKEAEAALALEKEARAFSGAIVPYHFDLKVEAGQQRVCFRSMFEEILYDVEREKAVSEIAARFHQTIAQAIVAVSKKISQKYAVKDVYLSGGVFMNDLLCGYIKDIGISSGLNIIFGQRPLTTDLGIARGQIAACMMSKNQPAS